MRRKTEGNKATTSFFTCRNVKTSGVQCKSSMKIVSCNGITFEAWTSTESHNCLDLGNASKPPLSAAQKNSIRVMFSACPTLSARGVARSFLTEGLNVPTRNQINFFLKSLKKGKFTSSHPHIGEMEKYFLENLKLPLDPCALFVVAYEIILKNRKGYFRCFLSLCMLLKNAMNSSILVADGTHKLNWHHYPSLVVGTIDQQKSFHILGLAVTFGETELDYKFLFESLKKGVSMIGIAQLCPKYVADAAGATRNAAISVFGKDLIIVMCWFHMKAAVMKRIAHLKLKPLSKELLSNIGHLHLSQSPSIFLKACDLFYRKWVAQPDFICYFIDNWINQNNNWYIGCGYLVPKTNNALESFNGRIKKDFTFHWLLPMPQFIASMEKLILVYSRKYQTGKVSFSHAPELDKALWTRAFTWVHGNA